MREGRLPAPPSCANLGQKRAGVQTGHNARSALKQKTVIRRHARPPASNWHKTKTGRREYQIETGNFCLKKKPGSSAEGKTFRQHTWLEPKNGETSKLTSKKGKGEKKKSTNSSKGFLFFFFQIEVVVEVTCISYTPSGFSESVKSGNRIRADPLKGEGLRNKYHDPTLVRVTEAHFKEKKSG